MSDLSNATARLESALVTPIGSSFNLDEVPDVLAQLLAQKRSPNTRKAYQKDLKYFFQEVANSQLLMELENWRFHEKKSPVIPANFLKDA